MEIKRRLPSGSGATKYVNRKEKFSAIRRADRDRRASSEWPFWIRRSSSRDRRRISSAPPSGKDSFRRRKNRGVSCRVDLEMGGPEGSVRSKETSDDGVGSPSLPSHGRPCFKETIPGFFVKPSGGGEPCRFPDALDSDDCQKGRAGGPDGQCFHVEMCGSPEVILHERRSERTGQSRGHRRLFSGQEKENSLLTVANAWVIGKEGQIGERSSFASIARDIVILREPLCLLEKKTRFRSLCLRAGI